MTTASEQLLLVKRQFLDEKISELVKAKPIVFTDCDADGTLCISNVGDGFATNVWYVAADEPEPLALGSLGVKGSRQLRVPVAARHLLIAEQRPRPKESARRFTPTLNARNGPGFAHGFVPAREAGLHYQGSLKGYLASVPALFERLRTYDPLTHAPDDD